MLCKRKKERKKTPMLLTAWIMVLKLHFRVGLSVYVIPQRVLRQLKGPPMTSASFRRWTPWTSKDKPTGTKGKSLGCHIVGWKHHVHLDTPTMVGWTIGDRVHQKSSARDITHLSIIIPTLVGLTSEFPKGIQVKTLDLSHPYAKCI